MHPLEIALTLIGGPTLSIEIGGYRLVTDPTFDGPGTYPSGTVTLEKTAGPAIVPADIGPVDAVLLSHDQHHDNLDRGGRAFLAGVPRTFTTPVGAQRLGGTARGLAPWQSAVLERPDANPLMITATPARHGPPGIEPIAGEVTGFVVGVNEPGDAIYVSGDTVWYEGVAEVARRYRPGLVVLFTGSAETRGRFHLTMDANDALEAAHAFGGAQVVGVHNHGWRHFTETQDELAQAFSALGEGHRLHPLSPGERLALTL